MHSKHNKIYTRNNRLKYDATLFYHCVCYLLTVESGVKYHKQKQTYILQLFSEKSRTKTNMYIFQQKEQNIFFKTAAKI